MAEAKKGAKKAAAKATAPTAEMSKGAAPAAKASGNKDSNLLAALSYLVNLVVLPWSFAIYFLKKEDAFVRFHAFQAGVLWVAALVVAVVLMIIAMVVGIVLPPLACIIGLLQMVISLAFLAALLYGAFKAFEGARYELPYIGEFTNKYM